MFIMDAPRLRALIQEELQQIIRIQHLLQIELDEINTLTKLDGNLDIAVTEGMKSLEQVACLANITLDEDAFKKIQEKITNAMNMEVEMGNEKS